MQVLLEQIPSTMMFCYLGSSVQLLENENIKNTNVSSLNKQLKTSNLTEQQTPWNYGCTKYWF